MPITKFSLSSERNSGDIRYWPETSYPSFPRPSAGVDESRWLPYCPKGKHDVKVADGREFHQAETIAVKLIEAEQRRRRSAG